MINKFDVGGACWEQGQTFEKIAMRSLQQAGVDTRDSTPDQDYYEHTDFFAYSKRGGRWISVDAKAMKRVSRRDSSPQDELAYVEWKNTAGFDGWMRKGADVILFERESDMITIARKDLLAFCEERVDQTKVVDRARDSLYCLYSRRGRSDVISMIKLVDLPQDKIKVWGKV